MSVLTRIRNNQILDATIYANAKIVPGSIVGSLFNSNLTTTSDVTIGGNLTVLGTSTYMTVASTNTYVNDPLIVLNNAFSGTNQYDLGFIFNRGVLANQALIWDESEDEFRFIATAETGTTYGNVVTSTFSNVRVGNISVQYYGVFGATVTVSSGNVDVNYPAGGISTTGNIAINATNGGSLTTISPTFNLVDANATTVNFARAATLLTMGATTGVAAVQNANIWLPNATTVGNGQDTLTLFALPATVTAFGKATLLTVGETSGTLVLNNPTVAHTQSTVTLFNSNVTVLNGLGAASTVNLGATSGVFQINNPTVAHTQSSVNLFNANVTTLNFAGAASTINMGANSGTLTIGNPTVVGTQTTQNLYNTTATTLNFAGAATTLTAGAATGLASIRNQVINFPNLTNMVTDQTSIDVFNANVTTMNLAGAATDITIGSTAGTANIRVANVNYTNATTFYAQQDAINVFNTPTTVRSYQGAVALTLGATTGIANIRNQTINFPNANDVITDQSSLNLFNANVATLNMAGAATVLVLGATSGKAYIRNANLTLPNATTIEVGQSDVTIANTAATTINAFGAATTLNFAAGTGTTTVRNSLQVGQILFANSGVASTNLTTGALIVSGGQAVTGNLNVGGNLLVNNDVVFNENLTVSPAGITYFQNTTNSTNSPNSGAVQIVGGASISKDLFVGGNLYVSNIFSTGYTTLSVTDPLLYLTASNTFPYTYDIGVHSQFTGPDSRTGTGNIYQHTGIVRDASDYTWKFFSNVVAEPGSTVQFDSDTQYDPVKAGNLTLTFNQEATSTTTGSFKTAGGIGVAGNVFIGGAYIDTSSSNFVFAQTPATANVLSAGTSVQIGAAAGVLQVRNPNIDTVQATLNLFTANATTVNFASVGNVTLNTPTGTTTARGNVDIQSVKKATAYNSAALTVAGGIGVNGNIFINDTYIDTAQSSLVFGATPVTANLLSAGTSVQIGAASGLLQIRNPSIDTVQATLNLFTANATTINFASVGNVTVGAPSGTTTTRGNLDIQSVRKSTVYNTGALTIAGGLGVTGNIFTNDSYLDTAQSNFLLLNTPTTVDAFKAGTDIEIGATTGTVIINNPTVRGSQTTQALYNTVTETINFGGAANINLGHTSGWANVRGSANVQSVVDSTEYDNGALLVQGGVGVRGNVNVRATKRITIGADIASSIRNDEPIASYFDGNLQAAVTIQNINSGANATAGFTSFNDNEDFLIAGILSTNFESPVANIYGRSDAVVRHSGPGNLVLGTTAAGSEIKLHAGGLNTTEHYVTISSQNANVSIVRQKVSTSHTTGAFTVTGGVGFGSNLNVARGAVINNTADQTGLFQVKGSNDAALIIADPTRDSVVIGGVGNTTVQPGVGLKVGGTGAIIIPVGTNSQRPGTAGNVDVEGMMRFNSTSNQLEFYIGGQWSVAGSSFTLIATDAFYGDGANVAFTMGASSTTAGTIVSINGVVQIPTTSYSVTGATLTFTEAPAVGDTIDVRRLTTTATVDQLANGFTIFNAGPNWGNILTGKTGGSSVDRLAVSNEGDVWLTNGANLVYNQFTGTNISANATPYVVASFSQTQYTTAKYIIQVKNDASAMQSMEALLVTDQAGNAYVTTYAVVTNGTQLGTLSANVVAGNVNLYYTNSHPNGINSNVKVQSTYII